MKKFISVVLAAVVVAAGALLPGATSKAAGGEWIDGDGGWWYKNADGSYAYSEWVDGYWLSSDGYWTYKNTASWKSNSTGWWYEDTAGWYPINTYQWIDGKKYKFNAEGYCELPGWVHTIDGWYYVWSDGVYAQNEWVDGYWIGADQYWTYQYTASWKQNDKGWWYEDTNGWYPVNETVRIDGVDYDFDENGYLIYYTKLDGNTGDEISVTFDVTAANKDTAAKQLGSLLGSYTVDGTSKAVTVDGVKKTISNKSGVVYIDDTTLTDYVSKSGDGKTVVKVTFNSSFNTLLKAIKLTGSGKYTYDVTVGSVKFSSISATNEKVTFTANGTSYEGEIIDGSLYVKGDQTAATFVTGLKSAKAVKTATLEDHK